MTVVEGQSAVVDAFANVLARKQMTEQGGLAAFIERHLLGPRGVGKTHIAGALALKATKAGRKTRFITAADLMNLRSPNVRDGSPSA